MRTHQQSRQRRLGARLIRSVVENLEDRRLFAAGALDTSFSGDGKTLTAVGNSFDLAQGSAVQSDGKTIVVGSSGGNVAVLRYNANGSVDTSFGNQFDGRTILDLGSSSDTCYDVGLDSLGRIYLACNGSGGGVVVRLTSSGSLDSGFSGDGKYPLAGSFLTGLDIGSDNKVVVCGDSSAAGFEFMAARFTTGGSLDNTYDSDGVAIHNFTGSGFESAADVIVRDDGMVVVAGTVDITADGNGYNFAYYATSPTGQYYLAGNLDVSAAGRTDFGTSIALGPGDTFFIGGQSYVAFGQSDMAVVKYNANFTRSNTFGGADGIAKVSFSGGGDEGANDLVVQPDGKVVLAGDNGAGDYGVARLTTAGNLDGSFDGDGKRTFGMGGNGDLANGISRLSSGDLIVTGRAESVLGGLDFGAARLNSNGSLDTGFDFDGKAITDIDTADDFATDVVVTSDSKVITVGTRLATGSAPFGEGDFAITRHTSSGNLDSSFSGDGRLLTDWGGDDRATAVAIQGDGKILVAGYTNPGPGIAVKFAVARYNANGTLDNTFSGDGKQTIAFGTFDAYARDMRIQSNGKIVIVGGVAGTGGGPTTGDMAVCRLNANGSLDNTFSGDGKQTINVITNPASVAEAVAIQADGKIVLGGRAGFSGAIVRLTSGGSLDNTFSGDGMLTEDFDDFPTYYFGLDLDAGGKIVVGGSTGNTMVLARYNANGTLDNTFDGDGKKKTFSGRIHDVQVQTSGKIVVAGTNQAGGGTTFRVARFNSNGSNDNSFSGDALADTSFLGQTPRAANALAFGPGGKLVVAGFATVGYQNQEFALARYSIV